MFIDIGKAYDLPEILTPLGIDDPARLRRMASANFTAQVERLLSLRNNLSQHKNIMQSIEQIKEFMQQTERRESPRELKTYLPRQGARHGTNAEQPRGTRRADSGHRRRAGDTR